MVHQNREAIDWEKYWFAVAINYKSTMLNNMPVHDDRGKPLTNKNISVPDTSLSGFLSSKVEWLV